MHHVPASSLGGWEPVSLSTFKTSETHQSTPGSEPGNPQPPTRACVRCARAKAKCVPDILSLGSCDRCDRLKRPCEPAAPRARAQPRKRKALEINHAAKGRVEMLEERLDGIVTLLRASKEPAMQTLETQPQVGSSASTLSHPSVDVNQQQNQLSVSDPFVMESAENWDERLLRGGTIRQRFALIGSYNPSIDPPAKFPQPRFNLMGVDLGGEDPEKLLCIFRDEMNPNFPFISIPGSVSVDEMRKDQPSLLTAVMAVTSRDSSNQLALGKILMQQIADRMVINGERNMDLLLAILTFAGWCYHHFFNIPQLTSLMSLASTLVGDLGLMKPPSKDSRGFFDAAIRESAKAREQCIDTWKPITSSVRVVEERRAVLGFWFLTSIIGSFFQKLDTARWTPYLNDCCTVLHENGHHHDDRYAVALIKMQLVSEKIFKNPWHGTSEAREHVAPPVLYLQSLGSEIRSLRAELSAEMESNPLLLLHYHNLELSLYKIGLASTESLSAFTSRDFNRMEHLFASTEAVRAFSDNFLSIPATKYHTMPIKIHMDLTWNLAILQMLSTFEHPDWNVSWLRETINFPELLGKLATNLSEVKAALNLDPTTEERLDMFSQSAKKMNWIKMFVEKAIPGMSGQAGESRIEDNTSADMFDFNGGEFMDFMDDAWMKDMLGPWE